MFADMPVIFNLNKVEKKWLKLFVYSTTTR